MDVNVKNDLVYVNYTESELNAIRNMHYKMLNYIDESKRIRLEELQKSNEINYTKS